MAIRAAVQYIGHYIIRELGLGCYAAASAAIGATTLRVMDPRVFDPVGGTIWVEDNDNLIIYTGINGDLLTGIPASSTGSISAIINPFTSASRDLIYRGELITSYELEILIDRYRRWIDGVEAIADVQRKRFSIPIDDRLKRPVFSWFDTSVSLRDDTDDNFVAVTADTISYENGTFEFTNARTDEKLYVSGWVYNPYFSIADFLETFANDSRWLNRMDAGQLSETKADASAVANRWRQRGLNLNI